MQETFNSLKARIRSRFSKTYEGFFGCKPLLLKAKNNYLYQHRHVPNFGHGIKVGHFCARQHFFTKLSRSQIKPNCQSLFLHRPSAYASRFTKIEKKNFQQKTQVLKKKDVGKVVTAVHNIGSFRVSELRIADRLSATASGSRQFALRTLLGLILA